MPELPDLEYVAAELRKRVVGQAITGMRVREPIVLRVAVPGELSAVLRGLPIAAVRRRGQFLEMELGATHRLVVHAMLAGKFKVVQRGAKEEGSLCFTLELESGSELRYLDDRKMGKAYFIPRDGEAQVPGLLKLGVDVLSPAFTLEHFSALASKRRDQVRPFIMDKSAISAIGNAYADEILFEAKIHPKAWARQLTPPQLAELHRAIGSVLRHAIQEVASRKAPIEEKIRDFLKVRGRAGQPCPRCGAKIREARVVDGDACFCPECQPATRTLFIDWSRAGTSKEPEVSASTPPPDAPAPGGATPPRPKRPRARGRGARGS